MQRSRWILGALVLSVATAFGQGTILWDEGVNGPLSNGGGGQTPLGSLQVGTNSVLGASEFIPDGIYGDYFTFTVATNNAIAGLRLSANRPVAVWFGSADFSTEYGYVIRPANGDILPQLGLAAINPGAYGAYIKSYDFDSGPSTANYRLDFVAQAVPEPASVWLLLGGLGWLGFRGWRNARLKV